jgi:hypothetical protein
VKSIVVAIAVLMTVALPSAAPAQPSARAAETCSHDVHAVIAGEEKCLGPGEYCKARDARQYLRYGFECVGSPARLRRRR